MRIENNNMMKKGDGIVYHYTSLDTFFKILDGIKYEHLIFYASDIFTMNDPTELYFGFRKLWKLLPSIENELYKSIRNNDTDINHQYLDDSYRLSNMWKGLGGKDSKWLKTYLEELHQSYNTPFVISFSCHEDYLPMWTTYGDNGHGVAIGIDVQSYYNVSKGSDGVTYYDMTNAYPEDFSSLLVSYDKITIKHPLARYIRIHLILYLRSITNCNGNTNSLYYLKLRTLDRISKIAASMIKDEAYAYESESRLIVERLSMKDIKFRINLEKKLLPYIKVGIPISKLKRIVIGPSCDYISVKSAIKARLSQLNIFLDAKNIVESAIPYRSSNVR